MFKVGDKVVIKESEQYCYRAPYDGVVKKVSDHSCRVYRVEFSDGEEIWMREAFLQAAEAQPPGEFKVGDTVQIKPCYQTGFYPPYEGLVVQYIPAIGKYEVKFPDSKETSDMPEEILELLPSQDYEKLVEILRGAGYFVEKL